MRVPDQISKTVLFLGILTGEEEKYIGTGYIVTVAYGPGQVFTETQESVTTSVRVPFAFLVTARHIAEALEGQDFYIRANGKDKKVKVIQRAYDSAVDELERLLTLLLERRSRVRDLILSFKNSSRILSQLVSGDGLHYGLNPGRSTRLAM